MLGFSSSSFALEKVMAKIKPMRAIKVAPTRKIWVWGFLNRMLGVREAMILSHCRLQGVIRVEK